MRTAEFKKSTLVFQCQAPRSEGLDKTLQEMIDDDTYDSVANLAEMTTTTYLVLQYQRENWLHKYDHIFFLFNSVCSATT